MYELVGIHREIARKKKKNWKYCMSKNNSLHVCEILGSFSDHIYCSFFGQKKKKIIVEDREVFRL